jgi:hypothetical protein
MTLATGLSGFSRIARIFWLREAISTVAPPLARVRQAVAQRQQTQTE